MKRTFLLMLFLLPAAGAVLFAGCKDAKPDKSQMSRVSYYNDMIKEAVNVSPQQLDLKLPDDKRVVYGIITMQNIADMLVIVSAAYGSGEALDIAYGGSSFVNAGEKGTSSGISGLLFANAKKYLKYYESDIEKYWKGSSDEKVSENLLMTVFISPDRNKEIREEVKKFIASSQNAAENLTETEKDASIPAPGEIKIIFLTNKGRYFVRGTMSQIRSMGSGFAGIFKAKSGISDIVFRNFAPAPAGK
jgi:hypothetical protein